MHCGKDYHEKIEKTLEDIRNEITDDRKERIFKAPWVDPYHYST